MSCPERSTDAELWELRERVKGLEAKLAERDAKPDKPPVPTPEELIARWQGRYAALSPGSEERWMTDELNASLAAHPRPVARELTRRELLDIHDAWDRHPDAIAGLVKMADELRGLRP